MPIKEKQFSPVLEDQSPNLNCFLFIRVHWSLELVDLQKRKFFGPFPVELYFLFFLSNGIIFIPRLHSLALKFFGHNALRLQIRKKLTPCLVDHAPTLPF